MSRRIFNFVLDGRDVLGFDTGLNAQAFAQAKMAQFITTQGYIIRPDGKVESWQPEGVTEQKTMIVWGSSFPGEQIIEIIDDTDRKDEAMNALRLWLKATLILEDNFSGGKDTALSGPAGTFIVSEKSLASSGKAAAYPAGTVFIPPVRLLKRSLEAEGLMLKAETFFHPDLEGKEGVAFSAGVMLYCVFCGTSPFVKTDSGELRQDIREAVFVPPELAAPGLAPEMARLIKSSLGRKTQGKDNETRPLPEFISDFIGAPSSKPVSFWVKTLDAAEQSKYRLEYEKYSKKKALTVKTRRFMTRYAAVIIVALLVATALTLIVTGEVKRRAAEMAIVKGLAPFEVAELFYGSFNTIDHTAMEACVSDGAGRGDIETVVNVHVITRIRQAYETPQSYHMSPREWLDTGRPATEKVVFGVTELDIKPLSETGTLAKFEVNYLLWMPGRLSGESGDTLAEREFNGMNGEFIAPPPEYTATKDIVTLAFNEDVWRITDIERTVR